MQLGEQLLVSSVNLPGTHFYPLESARGGGGGPAGHLPGATPLAPEAGLRQSAEEVLGQPLVRGRERGSRGRQRGGPRGHAQ